MLCHVCERLPNVDAPRLRGEERLRDDSDHHLAKLAPVGPPERGQMKKIVEDGCRFSVVPAECSAVRRNSMVGGTAQEMARRSAVMATGSRSVAMRQAKARNSAIPAGCVSWMLACLLNGYSG